MSDKDLLQRMRRGQQAATALAATGQWSGPRDPVSERAVEEVRRRWVRIEQRARQAREG